MLLGVLVELIDFVFKAVVAYGRTAEGQAEFEQIYQAAQGANVSDQGLTGSDGNASQTGKPESQAQRRARVQAEQG